jgi:hypothetical protein
MVKKPSTTKNAIRLRERYAQVKAAKGSTPSKPLILPPMEQGWKEHHAHPAYHGRPDGKIWSAKLGRVLEGCIDKGGYIYIDIDKKRLPRSRFNLSLSLGRAIKVKMECDHIVPVSRGGGDDWANLQELTKEAHALKTALDNPEKGKKAGITRGVSILARHAGTGDETRFDSVKDAVIGLGINNQVIARSLKGETIKGDYVFSYTREHLIEHADLPGEMWLEAVSSWGVLHNIKASDRGRIQNSSGRRSYGSDSSGYKRFGAMIDKKPRDLRVHDVITRTFLEPPPSSDHSPDHIDGDKSDNRVENSRWATPTEQNRNKSTNRRVVQLDLITGEQVAIFGSIAAAVDAVGTSATNITKVAGGRRRTAGAFGWKYLE